METLVKQDDNLTNDTHSFFESKEHYLQFIAAWKKSLADGYHERDTYTVNHGTKAVPDVRTYKYPSSLTCVHHLIYNALRKKDLHKSFAPLTNEGRLNAHASRDPYRAFYGTVSQIRYALGRWGNTDRLKEPFGDTVTDEMLKELLKVLESVKM